jgi:chromosome segregation ATPase
VHIRVIILWIGIFTINPSSTLAMRNKQTKRKDASTVGTVNMVEAAETETARLTSENVRLTMEIARLNAENSRLAQETERVGQSAEGLALAKSELATVKGELASVHVQRESVAEELRTVRHELGVLRAEVARLVGENQELDMRCIRVDEEFVEVRGELVKLREELQMAEAGSVELQSANTRMAEELEAASRLNVAMKDRVSEMEMDEIRAGEEMAVLRAEVQASKMQTENLGVMDFSLPAAEKCISERDMERIRAGKRPTTLREELETSQVGMKILSGLNSGQGLVAASMRSGSVMTKLEQIWDHKNNLILDLHNRLMKADLNDELIRDNNNQLKRELRAVMQDSESLKEQTKILHGESHALAKDFVAVKTQLNSVNNSLDMAQAETEGLEANIRRLVEEAAAKDGEIEAMMSEQGRLRIECNRLSSSNSELEHQKATLQDDLTIEKKKTIASYLSSRSKLALMGKKSRQLEVVSTELRSATEERSKLQRQNSSLRRALQASARAQGKVFVESPETK